MHKLFKYLGASLVAFVLVSCSSTPVSFKQPYASAVQVKINVNSWGSGTVAYEDNKHYFILTAGHVGIQINSASRIVTENCGVLPIAKVGSNLFDRDKPFNDIGWLLIDKPINCKLTVSPVANKLVIAEPVVMVGFPGLPIKVLKEIVFGYVSAFSIEGTVFSSPGAPGNSGSAFINSDGEVVGIVLGPATTGYGFIRSPSLQLIKTLLDEAKK